jgi:hypothetical protein
MNTTPHLLDPAEAGKLLRMLPVRVVRLAKRGDLPCIALPNGEYRFVLRDLEQWIASCRRPVPVALEGRRDE